MEIVLNIDSQELQYESQILVNSFLNGMSSSEERQQYEEKKIGIQISPEEVVVSCDNLVYRGTPEGTDKKYVKAELKRQIYQLMHELTGEELPWGALTGIRPTKLVMGLLEEQPEISDEEITAFLKEKYLVSDEKIALGMNIARREKDILRNIDYRDGYSLYIGIPFCPTTCLYCSFTSYPIGAYAAKSEAYVSALLKEIDYASEAFRDRKLNTIYFGGGTPTTLTPEQLDRLLGAVRDKFDLSYNQEFTVEAGRPDSITKEKLLVLKKHGVTRISINPQTMKQETLDLIGRYHTVEQVRDTFTLARSLGFDNINMDFIVGLPNETIDDIRYSMEETKKLNPDSITVHSLAIKRAARLNIFKEQYKELSIENNKDIMKLCSEYAKKMEMTPYYMYRQKNIAGNMENVGYARDRKAGIYNILIMEEKQTILALGAGAVTKCVLHEENRIERVENVKNVDQYIDRIDEMIERKKNFFDGIRNRTDSKQ
ncbi:MAG: coproporphyrinogen dehydrogenase HemZ [Lachnospiraceae bacterium]|nr:coproporphyrinogen dehydrogenase HemZ [Lachnospiraceae bacterium]